MIEKLTNCPNCNGRLNETGRCEFCGSKVYDFLTIDFNGRNMPSAKTYIRLKANGKIVLAPVIIDTVSYEFRNDTLYATDITEGTRHICVPRCYPEMNVNFIVVGDMIQIDEGET